MKSIPAIILVAVLSGLSLQAQDYGSVDGRARDVSLVNLIVQPEKYADMVVRVRGALHWEFEGSYLFLTRDHLEAYDTTSAIEIRKSKREGAPTENQLEECSGALVALEGLIRKNAPRDGYHLEITRVLVRDGRRSQEKQKESNQPSEPTAPSGRGSP
jgi:hypothetical protein